MKKTVKKGTYLIVTGLLLIAAGLALLFYNLWDDDRAGAVSEEDLEQLLPELETLVAKWEKNSEDFDPDWPEIEYPDYVLNPDMEMPVKKINTRSYIAVLKIPALELELPVARDWNNRNLLNSPCRYRGTVYKNDMVICAHNYDRHFGRLKNLNYGDKVFLTDMDGNQFVFTVGEVENLGPFDVEEMTESDWDLTLFTCTVGGRTRVTVRCERVRDD